MLVLGTATNSLGTDAQIHFMGRGPQPGQQPNLTHGKTQALCSTSDLIYRAVRVDRAGNCS